jgi:hypothetical protein
MADRSKWWIGKPGLVGFTAVAAMFWVSAVLAPDHWFPWIFAGAYTVFVAVLWGFLRDRRHRQRETP